MGRRLSGGGALVAAVLVCAAGLADAQDTDPFTTSQEVREEIDQAMDAIAAYSAQERDQALTRARTALDRLDAEIERREHALQENWSEMSEEARQTARAELADLRAARNRLGERFGALQAGTADAWDELSAGFSDAWDAFSRAWDANGPAE